MEKKILVIDDNPTLVRGISAVLSRAGFEVLGANSGQEGLRLLFNQKPNLVLLDVIMPKLDGWQTCSRIRDISDVPVIMLTGMGTDEQDVVRGLDCGADDYIIKPVGNKELVARVRAILRRAESPSALDTKSITYDDDFLTVDIAERKIIVNGERIRLTPIEFRLFALLIGNAGRVLTHKQLLEKVWGWEYVDDLDHLRIYIWHLRHKIEPDPSQPKYILTEPGVGYYFYKAS